MHVCSAANGAAAAASAATRAAAELRIIPPVPRTWQVQDFLEKSTREERQGLVVDGVPDAELFFVDKVRRVQCWIIFNSLQGLGRARCTCLLWQKWLLPSVLLQQSSVKPAMKDGWVMLLLLDCSPASLPLHALNRGCTLYPLPLTHAL